MSHAEILIPFSLPPAEHARDLLLSLSARLEQRGLAILLARGNSDAPQRFDDFSPLLPHERWLEQQTRPHPLRQQFATQLATQHDAHAPPHHYWFMLNPVHLHIARNHLVLTDQRQLALTEEESQALFTRAALLCQESGVELRYGSATTWWLQPRENWTDFITSSPDAACGHNIEIWSPKGKNELAWRKLQNDIQMDWYMHPVNTQREQQGQKTINGLWLWGGADIPALSASSSEATTGPTTIAQLIHHPELLILDQLSTSALAGDWGTWLENMVVLEQTWFKPLYDALTSRQLPTLRLHFSNSNTLLSLEVSTASLRRFWRRPTLKKLA
jgi:hypothetical protein